MLVLMVVVAFLFASVVKYLHCQQQHNISVEVVVHPATGHEWNAVLGKATIISDDVKVSAAICNEAEFTFRVKMMSDERTQPKLLWLKNNMLSSKHDLSVGFRKQAL